MTADLHSLRHGPLYHLSDPDPIRRTRDPLPPTYTIPFVPHRAIWVKRPFRRSSPLPIPLSPPSSLLAYTFLVGLQPRILANSTGCIDLPGVPPRYTPRYSSPSTPQYAPPSAVRPLDHPLPTYVYRPTPQQDVHRWALGNSQINPRRVLPYLHVCWWSHWRGMCDGYGSRVGGEGGPGFDLR